METLASDLKYALRQLAKAPGFTFAAIFALALGIGANVTIFSTVNAVILNSAPFRMIKDPHGLVSLYERNPTMMAFINQRLPVRFKSYSQWTRQARSFEGIAAYHDTKFDLASSDTRNREPEQVAGLVATPNFLPLLGIAPELGRNFKEDESEPGRGDVTMISDSLWHSRFGGDPRILGKTIKTSEKVYRIIGVLPAGFELPAETQGLDESRPNMWVPMNLKPTQTEQDSMALTVLARLKPRVSLAQARAEMGAIEEHLEETQPSGIRGYGVNLFPTIAEDTDPDLRRSLYVLQVAVGFVLLIACANIANLLLTKAAAREREIAVRFALGASRWRIIRQTLSESIMLGVFGGAAGLMLAFGGLRLVSYLAPKEVHGFHELEIDPLVLGFTAGVTLLAGILFGLVPALHSARESIAETLGRGSRSVIGSGQRFRGALVVVEISLSVVLLVGAGLTIRTLVSLMHKELGFRPDHVLAMSLSLPNSRYKNADQIGAFNDGLLERVRALPGVDAASLTTGLPMRTIGERDYELPGVPADPKHLKMSDWSQITDGHVQAMGMRLIQGRGFTRQDVDAAEPDVALVNEAFARANWAGQNPLGKTVILHFQPNKNSNYRVVGVVSDAHQFGPDATPHIEIYIPGHHMQSMHLVVRTTGEPLAMANAVKQQVWALDRDEPVSNVDSMDNVLSEWVSPRRFTMTLLLAFGAIALILAGVGLYSVLAYSVTLRTKEIGVRVALGAEPRSITGLVVRQGAWMTIWGLAVGAAGALALTRFMQSIIFGVSPFDAVTFVSVLALLIAVTVFASYIPARRAARIDPMDALRSE